MQHCPVAFETIRKRHKQQLMEISQENTLIMPKLFASEREIRFQQYKLMHNKDKQLNCQQVYE